MQHPETGPGLGNFFYKMEFGMARDYYLRGMTFALIDMGISVSGAPSLAHK
jgi:hypothetical protein